MVEAALAVTDPADVATFARLRALLAQCLIYTPDAARRVAAAHEALDLATRTSATRRCSRRSRRPCCSGCGHPAAASCAPGSRRDAIRAAESVGDPRLEFTAHQSAYLVAVESADHAVAARSLGQMRTSTRALDGTGAAVDGRDSTRRSRR